MSPGIFACLFFVKRRTLDPDENIHRLRVHRRSPRNQRTFEVRRLCEASLLLRVLIYPFQGLNGLVTGYTGTNLAKGDLKLG